MCSAGSVSTTSACRARACWARSEVRATVLLGLAGSSITHNYSLASGFTKTLSSSLLTDFRFGYFKYNPQTQKPDGGTPMSDFGIPNANTSDPKTAGLGAFLLGSDPISGQGCTTNNGGQGCVISSFGDGLGVARCNCPLTESEQQFQFVNNWTKMRGNHQIKFGGDIRYAMNLRIPSDNNRTGEYNFSPQATSNGGTGGLDLASFLLGQVTSFARYVNNPDIASREQRSRTPEALVLLRSGHLARNSQADSQLWTALGNLLP